MAKAICTPLHKKDSIVLYDATTGQKLQSTCREPTFLPLMDPQGHARTMHANHDGLMEVPLRCMDAAVIVSMAWLACMQR